MATIPVTIPTDFIRNMQQFMADVQKMRLLTDKFIYTSQQLPSVQMLMSTHHSLSGGVNQLVHVLRKMSASLQRTIDTIVNSLGVVARTFFRGLSVIAGTLAPIIGGMITVGSFAISAATVGITIVRWLWDKMVGLGDSVLQDYLESSGVLSSLGGYRAFRAVTGAMPADPGFNPGMAQARGSIMSQQFIALKMLNIKASKDTADMMMQTTIAAAEYMKGQRKGFELRNAAAVYISTLINPKRLVYLEEMPDEELEALKENYKRYKPLLDMPLKAILGWKNFSLQVKATGVQIQSIIADELGKPESGFVQALKSLSEAVTRFLRIFTEKVLTKENVDKLGKYIDQFANWLTKPDTLDNFKKLIKNFAEIVVATMEAIRLLAKIIADWRGTSTPTVDTLIGHGRRALGKRAGIQRPVGAPPAAQPSAAPIARYPGRARFADRIGIARPPGAERIAPREEDRYRAKVGEGKDVGSSKEVDRSRQKTGEGVDVGSPSVPAGNDPALKSDRAKYLEEMRAKPWLAQKLAEVSLGENTNPQANQSVIETVMNRASARGTTLEHELSSGYYPGSTYSGGARNIQNPKLRDMAVSNIRGALGGSNTSSYATDNSSQGLAYTERYGGTSGGYGRAGQAPGKFTFQSEYGGRGGTGSPGMETFFSPGWGGGGSSSREAYLKWRHDLDISRGAASSSPEVPNTINSQPPAGPVQRTGPGTWSDLPARSGHSPELSTVDPRLREILSAGRDQFEKSHPGYKVVASSGHRYGRAQSQHGSATGAVDVMILDPQGHEISNEGSDPTGLYHEYARHTYGEMEARHPELKGRFAWGGAFGTQLGGGGPPDLMHFDIGGERGHWTQNLPSRMGAMPGVDYGKAVDGGEGHERRVEPTIRYRDSSVWTKGADPLPTYDNPVDNLKVENRSDHDVAQAKTQSSNDDGSLQPAESSPEPLANMRGSTRRDVPKLKTYGADSPSAKFKEFRRSENIIDLRERKGNIRYSLGSRVGPAPSGLAAIDSRPSKLGGEAGMADILRMEQKNALSDTAKMNLENEINKYEKLKRGEKLEPEESLPSSEEGTGHG